jgi:hypothetical protein
MRPRAEDRGELADGEDFGAFYDVDYECGIIANL